MLSSIEKLEPKVTFRQRQALISASEGLFPAGVSSPRSKSAMTPTSTGDRAQSMPRSMYKGERTLGVTSAMRAPRSELSEGASVEREASKT